MEEENEMITTLSGHPIPDGMWQHYAAGIGDCICRDDTRPRTCADCGVDDQEDPPVVIPCEPCTWRSRGYRDGSFVRATLQQDGRLLDPPVNPAMPHAAGR